MIQIDHGLPRGGAGEMRRVLQARRLFGDLARRVPDRERGRRLEADLLDAWLCLQLARVADDPALARARRPAYLDLLGEALGAAGPGDPCAATLAER